MRFVKKDHAWSRIDLNVKRVCNSYENIYAKVEKVRISELSMLCETVVHYPSEENIIITGMMKTNLVILQSKIGIVNAVHGSSPLLQVVIGLITAVRSSGPLPKLNPPGMFEMWGNIGL